MRSSHKVGIRLALALVASCALSWSAAPAWAQGVTTGAITGTVVDAQQLPVPGASVVAVHEPSGTTYEAVTQGRWRILDIPGMRVGGPYTVTASLAGFQPKTVKNVQLSLGVAADLNVTLSAGNVTEEVTVTAVVRSGVQLGAHRRGDAVTARSSRRCPPYPAASTTSRA